MKGANAHPLLAERIDDALEILVQLAASRSNSFISVPPSDASLAAFQLLGSRVDPSAIVSEAIRDLSATPAKFSITVYEAAAHLVVASDQARVLSEAECGKDSKACYLRSSQYENGAIINWAFLLASIALAGYLVYYVFIAGGTVTAEQWLKWGVFALPFIAVIVGSIVQKRSGADSILVRYFRYRVLRRDFTISFRDWLLLNQHGAHGTDARVTRRQGAIISLFLILGWDVAVLHLSP